MKHKFAIAVLSILLALPCVLRAEEIEIQLMEVIQMTPLPGDDPLDDPTAFDVFITDHPELLMSFQNVSFATGAVALNPIYLIREL